MTVVDANNIIVADSRLDPLLSPVASENQRGEIGSGISNARGISKAQSLEGKIGNRLPWIDGLGWAGPSATLPPLLGGGHGGNTRGGDASEYQQIAETKGLRRTQPRRKGLEETKQAEGPKGHT